MIFIFAFSLFKVEFTPLEIGYTPIVIFEDTQVSSPIFFGVPLWEPPVPYDLYSFPLLLSYKIIGATATFHSWKGIHVSLGSSTVFSEMLVPYYFPIILKIEKEICRGKGLYVTSVFPLYKVDNSPGCCPVKTGIGFFSNVKKGYLMLEIGRKVVPRAYWGSNGYVGGYYLEVISGFKFIKFR
ncbi:MAG TPA: hypothetical protein ENF18_07110 [candidate division WOR-3 bacterium]|uniref:Uncharacterized protein n=1 Tax=candidate division WOR-3 bacterium TaxID=2052148 RepID=A0A7C0ZE68_UNCW3|nr:hypothetical protein [candidate division WOR-3 bacterium]